MQGEGSVAVLRGDRADWQAMGLEAGITASHLRRVMLGLTKRFDHGEGWRVSENIPIGDTVIIGGGTIVLSYTPTSRMMLGWPTMKMDTSALGGRKGL